MDGWVKFHRKTLEWEWWDEPNTFRLFVTLLLLANHKPSKWRVPFVMLSVVLQAANLNVFAGGIK